MPLGVVAIGALLVTGVSVFGIFLATLPAYVIPDSAPIRVERVRRFTPNLRAGITLVLDTLLAGVALLTAFLIRWEGGFIGAPSEQFLLALPAVMGFYAAGSIGFRTFDSGWRWFGLRDLVALGRCAVTGGGGAVFALWLLGIHDFPRSISLLYTFLALAFTVGSRLSLRLLWQSLALPVGRRRAAVLGVNGEAAIAILVLQESVPINATPVAVIDSDPACDRLRIHGVTVHCAGDDAPELLRRLGADLLVVPSAERLTAAHRRILEQCQDAGVITEQFEVGMRNLNIDGQSIDKSSKDLPYPVGVNQPVLSEAAVMNMT
jgi:FlaA1/EpsC-like NDP-sugar epimerase